MESGAYKATAFLFFYPYMEILQNVSLKEFNTFGIDVKAAYFTEVESLEDLKKLMYEDEFKLPRLVLGGGSNILFTKNFDGLVVKLSLKGKEIIEEDEEFVCVKLGAGEVWHEVVLFCIEKGWSGIENMSLIPGTVGAAPMQNIGAYGVEIKDVFDSLEAVCIDTGKVEVFDSEACDFGYRWSIFKGELKDKYIITSVTLKLSKVPEYKTEYGDIKSTLEEMGIKELSIKAVSDAVISIRQQKLPDPKKIGNAGSFFKNPEISTSKFNELKQKFENIVGYPTTPGIVKVPAGWLIDQAGWKGVTEGEIGVHKNQALVLVNYGDGKGNQIHELALKIKASVLDKYDITINPEVNIY